MTIGRIPNVQGGIQPTILANKGDLLSATSAATPANLSVGADGQLLYADSTQTTGLKWAAAPASGSMTLLSTTTLSGSSTTISSISQSYNNLYIFIYGLTTSANSYFRIAPNGSTNITGVWGPDDTDYNHTRSIYSNYLHPYGHQIDESAGQVTNNSDTNNAAAITIYNYANTSAVKPYVSHSIFYDGGPNLVGAGSSTGGGINTTSAISSLVFSMSSGTLSSGTVLIYGVK